MPGGEPTQLGQVFFVVEAALDIRHVLEVYLALVAHSVDVSGSIGPGHTGHAAARLCVPAANIHYLTNLTLPTYTQYHTHTNTHTHTRAQDTGQEGGTDLEPREDEKEASKRLFFQP